MKREDKKMAMLEDEFLGKDIEALGLILGEMKHLEDCGSMCNRELLHHTYDLLSDLIMERGNRVTEMFYEMHEEIKRGLKR